MKEIRKVLEWIASKFSKTTEPASEPDTLGDSIVEIHKSLGAIDDNMVGYYADTAPEPPQEANDQPATVMGWLETLPDGYRELAIKNARSGMDEVACTTGMADALYHGLRLWRTTFEGYIFWDDVVSHYITGSPLPPLPQSPPNDSNDPKFRIVPKDEMKARLDNVSPLDDIGDTTRDAITSAFIDITRASLRAGRAALASTSIPSFSKEILEQEFQTCIATENYERCAEIKVLLDKLNKVND